MRRTGHVLRPLLQEVLSNIPIEIEERMHRQLTSSFPLRWNPREHIPSK